MNPYARLPAHRWGMYAMLVGFMLIVGMLAGCPAPEAPKTLLESLAYADSQAAALQTTVMQLACPGPASTDKVCDTAGALLKITDARDYLSKLAAARTAISLAGAPGAGALQCMNATAGSPTACLTAIQSTLTEVSTFLQGIQKGAK